MKTILLIVDPQNDFISGALAVPCAEAKINNLIDTLKSVEKYDWIGITMDSHPENHCSFKEFGGIWPKHCVYNQWGWQLPNALQQLLLPTPNIEFFRKGTLPDKEEYSIFDNKADGVKLHKRIIELIKEENCTIELCGIAGDYCVLETLQGLRNFVPDTSICVRLGCTASIDGGEKLLNYLRENNINYID